MNNSHGRYWPKLDSKNLIVNPDDVPISEIKNFQNEYVNNCRSGTNLN